MNQFLEGRVQETSNPQQAEKESRSTKSIHRKFDSSRSPNNCYKPHDNTKKNGSKIQDIKDGEQLDAVKKSRLSPIKYPKTRKFNTSFNASGGKFRKATGDIFRGRQRRRHSDNYRCQDHILNSAPKKLDKNSSAKIFKATGGMLSSLKRSTLHNRPHIQSGKEKMTYHSLSFDSNSDFMQGYQNKSFEEKCEKENFQKIPTRRRSQSVDQILLENSITTSPTRKESKTTDAVSSIKNKLFPRKLRSTPHEITAIPISNYLNYTDNSITQEHPSGISRKTYKTLQRSKSCDIARRPWFSYETPSLKRNKSLDRFSSFTPERSRESKNNSHKAVEILRRSSFRKSIQRPTVHIVIELSNRYKIISANTAGNHHGDIWAIINTTLIQNFYLSAGHNGGMTRGREMLEINITEASPRK